MTTSHYVTVQDRGRVNVSRLATHDQYRVTVDEDETMVGEPTETFTLAELELLQNREMLETITKDLADPTRHGSREGTSDRLPLDEVTMEIRLGLDAADDLTTRRRSSHISTQRLYNDLNDALDTLEANHATDPSCSHHRYRRREIGTMDGFVIESSGERRAFL